MISEEEIRSRFPALKSSTTFLDNAGGSQLPDMVIRRMTDYMEDKFVQVGADYEVSRQATAEVERARQFLLTLFNGTGLGHVVMGPSTSALCAMLADCYRSAHDPGRSEIVVCQAGHEANVGPWVRLERSGYSVKLWKLNPGNFRCDLDELENLVTHRTRVVAFPHVSNLLGEVVPAGEICRIAHRAGARAVIDGVAYAPHRAIDVADIGADFYLFSHYKVFGPHMASLFGTHEALAELTGPNHYFIQDNDVPYKFELGGVLHEGCAGVLGLWEYLCFLTETQDDGGFDRVIVRRGYELIEEREKPLTLRLLDYLSRKGAVNIIGQEVADATRLPTISFTHQTRTSKAIAQAANRIDLGIRYGHFYAHRLCQPLNLDPEDAVVRVSMVHYNTVAEVDTLCEFFDTIL